MASLEYLVVAGGGGGGSGAAGYFGGAGGAGGYRAGTLDLPPGTYPVVVGVGGVYTAASDTPGTKGGDSSLATILATGGGRGSGGTSPGGDGGSGGGGSYGNGANHPNGLGNTPATTPAQGYNGTHYNTVGGGQRGPGGGSAGPGTGSGPGPGTVNSINGTAVTYATGGWISAPTGYGDGGGGGRSVGDGGPVGSNGFQGRVIIRYLTQGYQVATGGTVTTSGAYTVHTFANGQSLTVLPPGFDPSSSTIKFSSTAALALSHLLGASAGFAFSHTDNFFAPGPLLGQSSVTFASAGRLAPILTPLASLATLSVGTAVAIIPWESRLAALAVTRWSGVGTITDTVPVGFHPYMDPNRNSLVSVLGVT